MAKGLTIDPKSLEDALKGVYGDEEIRQNLTRGFCSAPPSARAQVAQALLGKEPPSGNGNGVIPGGQEVFPLLRDLIEDPSLLDPPNEILSKFAWRGRTTGLIGPDKSGKSTLAAHGVAALTTGGVWLGSRVAPGTAVVVAPDEALGDTVRRLTELGANPDRVRLLTLRPPDLAESLESLLSVSPADLVVVDSLAEWARLTVGRAPDDGDAAGWGAVVRRLVHLSRDWDCALLLLHHPRRADNQYRGSGEIAAALDCLLEMTPPGKGKDPTLRRFRGRARWPVDDFSIRLECGQFQLGDGGPVPLATLILMDLATNPGTSRTKQYSRLGGRKEAHVSAVNSLLETEEILERKGKLFLPGDAEEVLV